MGEDNTVDSEKDLNPKEQDTEVQEPDAQIKLTKTRFVLVLVGLVLAIFLVCSYFGSVYDMNLD